MSGQLSPQTHLLPLKECLPEFIEMVASHKHRGRKTACGVTAETVDAMFVQAGEPVGALGRLVYMIDPNDYRQSQLALHGMHLDEFVNYTLQHAWIVQEALQQPERNGRIHALQILAKVEAPPAPFLEAIAELAVSSAKTEREPAATLLEQDLQAAMPLLKAKAESGISS